jgi:adenosine deaminase
MLSRQYQLDYPHDDPEEFKKCVMLLTPAPSLSDFLKVFAAITDILRTKEAIERVAYEYCQDLQRQHVLYFECRYNPMSPHMSPEEYIEGATAGLMRGERDFGVKSRQILDFMRDSPENVARIVELAVKYKPRGVIGVDMAGDELLPLDPRHVRGFRDAKARGLHVTIHAGESGPAANVRQAIEELGAERIGHGYHVLDDEAIYRLAREKRIHFEGCPTSSIFTNSQALESHAIKRWALDGTSFSLSTDDPGVMENSMQEEYVIASQKMNLTKTQIVQSVLNAVKAAFLPDDEKTALLERVKEDIAEWEQNTHPN